jgi:transposase-like protein
MFIPPHCPNPNCDCYTPPIRLDWYRKTGQYPTITFGAVPRFQCKRCRRHFSKQTFSLDYHAKRRLDYRYIYNQINAGAGIRNIARDLNVKDTTISNRINRMARSAVLINQQILGQLPFDEDLVLDGLQNFCVSQYFPDNTTVVVGKDSQFVYDCDYATLRRGGRMTMEQKVKRAELDHRYRAPPRSVEKSFGRLLELIKSLGLDRKLPLVLYTDENKSYQRALWNRKGNREMMFTGAWRHHRTNSKEGRNQKNPLFAANYVDREIRKDMASQARETVQFPRNASNAMLRMNLYLFDHNVRKPFRVNDPEKRKLRHAHVAGLDPKILEDLTAGFFSLRVFKPKDLELSKSARKTVHREWVTPLKKGSETVWNYLAA